MNIQTDEWLSTVEAAELIGVTRQRVVAMATKDGSLDVITPWPRMSLVSRASVEAWRRGERPTRIGIGNVKRWIQKRADVKTVRDLDVNDLRDLTREFIEEARPRWTNGRKDIWALDMASQLWRTAAFRITATREGTP